MDYEAEIAKYKELLDDLNETPKDLWTSSNYVQNWMYHNQLFLVTFMSCSKAGTYSMEDL